MFLLAGDALPNLLVDQFDDEQVWQQLELQNGPCIDGLLASIARLSTSKMCGFGLSPDEAQLDPDKLEVRYVYKHQNRSVGAFRICLIGWYITVVDFE